MGPVSAEIEIDVPRQRAFEAIADLSLRPAFTDHFLTDFHLTRIEPTGVGAGARFRIAVRPRRIWMDTTIVEVRRRTGWSSTAAAAAPTAFPRPRSGS